MPTLASKWCEKGRVAGREEARKERREEGREEGVILILTGLLEHRFGSASSELVTQFQTLSVDELLSLSLFILDAASIDQVTERARQLRG